MICEQLYRFIPDEEQITIGVLGHPCEELYLIKEDTENDIVRNKQGDGRGSVEDY